METLIADCTRCPFDNECNMFSGPKEKTFAIRLVLLCEERGIEFSIPEKTMICTEITEYIFSNFISREELLAMDI